MKKLVGTPVLLNRETGKFEPAELFQELDQKNIEDFEQKWKPLLKPKDGTAPAADSHWMWAEKAGAAKQSLVFETFALECGGVTQGLMLVDLAQFARIPDQKGREIVYVDLLSSAPWNRRDYRPRPVFKGTGRVLLATAVSLSHELGFKGRVGLHSLRDSESWYANDCGFSDLGKDAQKQMLKYFEMTEAQAAAFLDD